MGRPRSSKTVVGKLFDVAESPIFLLDSRRRIVYCNPACAQWLSVDADEDLIGRQCDYHSKQNTTKSDSIAAGLCPPPEVFEGVETIARIHNGVEFRSMRFLPVFDQESGAYSVLGVPSDGGTDSEPIRRDEMGAANELHDQIRVIRKSLKSRYSLDRLVGQSPAMQLVRRQIEAAATSRSNVAVIGPAGSGRESIARTIHYAAAGSETRSLLPLTCELLDADLLSSMLDSFSQREQSDDQNTLLLLDVDMLSPDSQSALAEFLAEHRRLHVLSTAANPLETTDEVGAATFHPNLRLLLCTMTVNVPALENRLEDLPVLVQSAIEYHNANGQKQISQISNAALDRLATHQWQRNVAELFEIVGHAHEAAAGTTIDQADLPKILDLSRDAELHPRMEPEKIDLDQFLGQAESELIQRALRQTKGNKTQASALLGISRARLLRRIEQLDVRDDLY